jgi:hypothetical protein
MAFGLAIHFEKQTNYEKITLITGLNDGGFCHLSLDYPRD